MSAPIAFAVNDGIVYLLTACCGASAKGSVNSPTGVCCRACYAPIPEAMGWATMAADPNLASGLAFILRELGLSATEAADLLIPLLSGIRGDMPAAPAEPTCPTCGDTAEYCSRFAATL